MNDEQKKNTPYELFHPEKTSDGQDSGNFQIKYWITHEGYFLWFDLFRCRPCWSDKKGHHLSYNDGKSGEDADTNEDADPFMKGCIRANGCLDIEFFDYKKGFDHFCGLDSFCFYTMPLFEKLYSLAQKELDQGTVDVYCDAFKQPIMWKEKYK